VASQLGVGVQPGNGTGGEAFGVQPCVAFFDAAGQLVNTTRNSIYNGDSVRARLQQSSVCSSTIFIFFSALDINIDNEMFTKLPREARFAVLEQEGNPGTPEATIVDGWANFTGLKLDNVGDGFVINFYSNSFQVDSEPISILVGTPWELQIVQGVGTATGGVEFKPQPIVGIVDRGGNTVKNIDEGSVNVTICEPADGQGCASSPGGMLRNLRSPGSSNVDIAGGKATFSGLAIDRAGSPYQLLFHLTYSGLTQKITSAAFTVGVGSAAEVRIERHISGARGGLPFETQPRISVRDAGGNVVTLDALTPPYSEVEIYLVRNPTDALLSSELNATRTLQFSNGFAEGTDFMIDKVGQGYQLRFFVTMRTPSGIEHTLSTDSPIFDVSHGNPSELVVAQSIHGAFSGAPAFDGQPIIHVVDAGGNLLEGENSGEVTANLLVDPTGSTLTGTPIESFFHGVAAFRSLGIAQAGTGYVLQFTADFNTTTLTVNHTFNVVPSIEAELFPSDPQTGDLFGKSVSISDSTALIGAPKEDSRVYEVQRVTVASDEAISLTNEVQQIVIKGDHRTEIQEIVSCGFGGPSVSLSGFFVVTFGVKSTRPIRHDVHEDVLKSYLQLDIPGIGQISVVKAENEECDASNSFRWTIHFDNLQGEIPEIEVNYEGLSTVSSPDPTTFGYIAAEFPSMEPSSSATNVSVSVKTLQDSPHISGSFRIIAYGDGTSHGRDIVPVETVEIPISATSLQVKNAIEPAIRGINATYFQSDYDNFNFINVQRIGPDAQGGFIWELRFPVSASGVYDWKQLEINATGLSGFNIEAKTLTVQDGLAPVEGSFRLWFDGSGPTQPISYQESAAGFETKLEELNTLSDVSVARSSTSLGYTWTVTFVQTRSQTEFGFQDDATRNLPSFKAATFSLRGTGAHVLVEYAFGVDDMDTLRCEPSVFLGAANSHSFIEEPDASCKLQKLDNVLLPHERPVLGKFGHETGAAYVMHWNERDSTWEQAAKLRGSDSKSYDNFGWALSYDNSTDVDFEQDGIALIGAPYASYIGSNEVQQITCFADGGQLGLRFRTHETALFDHDITAPAFEAALEASSGIHDVRVVYYVGDPIEVNSLDSNSGHGLCQQSTTTEASKVTALITFLLPDNGDLPLLEPIVNDATFPSMPILFDSTTPVVNSFQAGFVEVQEIVKGNIKSKQSGDPGYNVGAAYIFVPSGSPESPLNAWIEEAKLLAVDGLAGDAFGFSVSIVLDTAIVGAPHHRNDASGTNSLASAGAVYVFFKGASGSWEQSQKLVTSDRAANDLFGSVVFIKGNSIFASAPGKNDGTGKVYIFKRSGMGLPFLFDQSMTPGDALPGDRFGSSLHNHANTLVIGAELADGPAPSDREFFPAGAEYHSGRARPQDEGAGKTECGAVYIYTRPTLKNIFTLEQKLMAPSPRSHFRFGHSVAIQRDILVVTEQEAFNGLLRGRRFVFAISSSAPSLITGGTFALSLGSKFTGQQSTSKYRRTRFGEDSASSGDKGITQDYHTDVFSPVQTMPMTHNVSAAEMRNRIVSDLKQGDVVVHRTSRSDVDGFAWTVTFVNTDPDNGVFASFQAINELHNDAMVTVSEISEPMPNIHGEAHLFTRDSGVWSAQVRLRPEVHQPGDLFGEMVSVQGRNAIVGAPNRDSAGLSNINSGSAHVFDIGFVNLGFESLTPTRSESDGFQTIRVLRCEPACKVGLSPPSGELPLAFGLDEEEDIQFLSVDGTALSRKSCRPESSGTDECLWIEADDHSWDSSAQKSPIDIVDVAENAKEEFVSPARRPRFGDASSSKPKQSEFSSFDFSAQSDFAPVGGQLHFDAEVRALSFQVAITNDEIFEHPDESVNLLLFSPGMRPYPGGNYWAVLTIEDDGDGGVGTTETYRKVVPESPAIGMRLGSATAIDGNIAAIAAPFRSDGSGIVQIHRRLPSGLWAFETALESPNATQGCNFGLSIALKDLTPHRIVVGAPGESPPAAYIFIREPSDPNGTDFTAISGTWQLEAYLPLDDEYVLDPRCSIENQCYNPHYPADRTSFFAGKNSVAIDGDYAAVGARGLEAVFMFRKKQDYLWYFFQLIKSGDYSDEEYPKGSRNARIYVERVHFGASVGLSRDTLVVGAPLAENQRYKKPNAPNSTSFDGLSCADTGLVVNASASKLYDWKLNAYGVGYEWAPANATGLAIAEELNGGFPLTPKLSCEETNAFKLSIRSSGIPDHPFGKFPISTDTLFSGKPDNPSWIESQQHLFELPRFPNITNVNPRSVLEDPSALPNGIVGFALNGIPFVNPFTEEGDDFTKPNSIAFSGNLVDLCNGAPYAKMYAYKGNPICLYEQPAQISSPQLETGKNNLFGFQENSVVNPSPGQRSPKIGYALDGFAIYGPFDESGALPSDLDACNGRFDTILGEYVYHVTPYRPPYIIGCFRGKISISEPGISNPFPEFSLGSANARDLQYFGKGAAFVFLLRDRSELSSEPTTVNGIDVLPRADPIDSSVADFIWIQSDKLTASDGGRADRFGQNVAIHADQVLVSAHLQSSRPRSTWDFETGDLTGWTATGTAFAKQPTFGDNPGSRNVYGEVIVSDFQQFRGRRFVATSNRGGAVFEIKEDVLGFPTTVLYGPTTTHVDHPIPITRAGDELRSAMLGFRPRNPQRVRHRGRFWIGTFENRPATLNDHGVFAPLEALGTTQGDGPVGSLTSDPFHIYGTKISFLIGGGCNIKTEFVELIIDGVSVRRETGRCEETMRRVVWDVSSFTYGSAMIRIVDSSSDRWGHINFDDVRFDWHPSHESRSTMPSYDGSHRRHPAGSAPDCPGEPLSGAVYAFRRRSGGVNPDAPCEIECNAFDCFFSANPPNRSSCVWEEQQKLQPSDKRALQAFGSSLAIDDENGLAVIGSPLSLAVNALNHNELGSNKMSGSIYVFKRSPELRSGIGTLLRKPYWNQSETFKVQQADKTETKSSLFAFSVGVSKKTVIVGAPGVSALAQVGGSRPDVNPSSIHEYPQSGAAYFIDLGAANISFKEPEFAVTENNPLGINSFQTVSIPVVRFGDLATRAYVAYHTSDITAFGISEAHAVFCQSLNYTDRGQHYCGDYVQQSGVLNFDPFDSQVEFEIRIINDSCNEHHPKFVRLQLSIPGGPPLLGEQYIARLRIDDDDHDEQVNRLFCPQVSKPLSSIHPFYAEKDLPDLQGTPARREPLPGTEHSEWILQNV